MASAKILAAAALLAAIPASLACSCLAVYYTPCDFVEGLAYDTSLVVRATALSRRVDTAQVCSMRRTECNPYRRAATATGLHT